MTIQETLELAVQHHQAGRLLEAESAYRQVLALQPDEPDALHLLGVLSGQSGQLDVAIDLIGRAIALRPNAAEFHSNLFSLAFRQNNLDLAAASFFRASALNPRLTAGGHALAVSLRNARRFDDALNVAARYLKQNPDDAEAYNSFGVILAETRRFDEAAAAFRRAIAIRPDHALGYTNLGSALRDLGNIEEAFEAHKKASELDPGSPSAWNNLGTLFLDHDVLDRAVDCYRKAIALDPNHATYHWNLSLVLLALGQFAEGWEEFEWRLKDPGLHLNRGFPQPQWDGSDQPGKRLLVFTEGGFGDAFHFIRYLPMLRAKARIGKILLECQPAIADLFAAVPGIDQIVRRRREPLPEFDLQIPLQSLPRLFATDLTNIPNAVPYLKAPPDRKQRWANRVPKDGKLNVGLVWAGSRTDRGRAERRTRQLAVFTPLAQVPNVRLFSLQKGPDAAQSRPPGMDLIDFTADLKDFADTAALIEQLDLVISVDTSVAHLAGALARPVWVLIFTPCDFRWLRDRDDSPWYPTMRLFRQPKPRDWDTPMRRLVEELCQLSTRNKR